MRTSQIFILLFVGTAVGCVIWLSFFHDWHSFSHGLSQENRAAQVTGAAVRPTSPIKIVIRPVDCTHVVSAEISGTQLTMYAENRCHHELDYMEWSWQSYSPDHTALHAGYANNASCPIPRVGGKAECVLSDWDGIPDDDRTATIEVWTSGRAR